MNFLKIRSHPALIRDQLTQLYLSVLICWFTFIPVSATSFHSGEYANVLSVYSIGHGNVSTISSLGHGCVSTVTYIGLGYIDTSWFDQQFVNRSLPGYNMAR